MNRILLSFAFALLAGSALADPVTVDNCGHPLTFEKPPERGWPNTGIYRELQGIFAKKFLVPSNIWVSISEQGIPAVRPVHTDLFTR